MTKGVNILSAGMVTAVGLNCAASAAAMRGGLDGFQETDFLAADGEWQLGAPVPLPRNWVGEKRVAHLAAGAVVDALDGFQAEVRTLTVILCLAEGSRRGAPVRDPDTFARKLIEFSGLPRQTKFETVEYGRPSGFVALERAGRILRKDPNSHVLIVGADSLLTGPTIAEFIRAERLLNGNNANGLIPGEAAAALLCTGGPPTQLAMTGLGLSRELAYLYNEEELPLRADGMTSAYREALEISGIAFDRIDYRISDLTGEAYFFKQTALSMQRLLREHRELQELWTPTECIGNVGAAAVPIMIAWALEAALKHYAPGNPVLIEASGDDGTCGAAVFFAPDTSAKVGAA
ncbi:3-oxoacyl-ACP synthase [uncultured Ruegeria sp.]|uniref:3-oxoacyl-ACP synthase n=1 Tax=uncultured Ruegeria sp. TaxID=259304 RepID=UPI00262FE391|nr:3-oxoacyl-ACP synthase [uncultured Ruegeria sp.]